MIKAFFLDFYGTVVHEDGEIIRKITDIIFETGEVTDKSAIGSFWWNEFQTMYMNSYGDSFETQRTLEFKSLQSTLQKFKSTANPAELSGYMFEHWRKPPIFEDAKKFFDICPIPIYIVSNIDTSDISDAIRFHNLQPAGVFTSEDAKAYKPRKELFELALNSAGLNAEEVTHIGDSISSDVNGASQLGIHAIWLNRSKKAVPDGVSCAESLLSRQILTGI